MCKLSYVASFYQATMQSEVTLSGNPVLLQSVVKPVNRFKYKKRAGLSRATGSVNKIIGDAVNCYCIIPIDYRGYGYITHKSWWNAKLIWGINPALKQKGS